MQVSSRNLGQEYEKVFTRSPVSCSLHIVCHIQLKIFSLRVTWICNCFSNKCTNEFRRRKSWQLVVARSQSMISWTKLHLSLAPPCLLLPAVLVCVRAAWAQSVGYTSTSSRINVSWLYVCVCTPRCCLIGLILGFWSAGVGATSSQGQRFPRTTPNLQAPSKRRNQQQRDRNWQTPNDKQIEKHQIL